VLAETVSDIRATGNIATSVEDQMRFIMCTGEEIFLEYEFPEEDEESPFPGVWSLFYQFQKEGASLDTCVNVLFCTGLKIWEKKLLSGNTWCGCTIDEALHLCRLLKINFSEISDQAKEAIVE
jgi:hypothetical protein